MTLRFPGREDAVVAGGTTRCDGRAGVHPGTEETGRALVASFARERRRHVCGGRLAERFDTVVAGGAVADDASVIEGGT